MKKRIYTPPKKQNEVSDPLPDYKTIPETKFSRKKENNLSLKKFHKTVTPKDFPSNCVTLDTFFSDLEDYIHKNETV
jgi:hypothetical protein